MHDGRTCLRKPERRQSSSTRRPTLSEQGNTVCNGEARVPVCVPVAFRHGFPVRLAACHGHTEANDVGSTASPLPSPPTQDLLNDAHGILMAHLILKISIIIQSAAPQRRKAITEKEFTRILSSRSITDHSIINSSFILTTSAGIQGVHRSKLVYSSP